MSEPAAPPLHFALSADRTRVTVTPRSAAPFDLTPVQLDLLIRALIVGRASMRPARAPDDPAAMSDVLTHDSMTSRLELENDRSGDMLIGLFHPGLGWLGAHLRPNAAARMKEVLEEAAARAMNG